jgi:hypothetical protein
MLDTRGLALGLTGVILCVTDACPRVLVVQHLQHADADAGFKALPLGPFLPQKHRTLELGLRHWLQELTGISPDYVEQIYTFGNQNRDPRELVGGPRSVTVAYLALVDEMPLSGSGGASWDNLYDYLPWEDWRQGRPPVLTQGILPHLQAWCAAAENAQEHHTRQRRVVDAFGHADATRLDGLRAVNRFELLYETGFVAEKARDIAIVASLQGYPVPQETPARVGDCSAALALDSRRILASALARIRAQLAYRPVVFELLPESFTLLHIQNVVEALVGAQVHKQNFRRMLQNADLVEPTGQMRAQGRGRPAALYRFKDNVTKERKAFSTNLPYMRA